MKAQRGWVYLVGAGPGDPGLITVRGLDLLRSADVVLYDRLVAPELVAEAEGAETIPVGKAPRGPRTEQARINSALISHARAGRSVVRLKGGDPFVFGRGGEEALALARAGIPFHVVPGITSAVAAAAYAGIPVTQRGVATSFAVVSGHDPDGIDWSSLARGTDTLVVMMGVETLDDITRRLLSSRRDPLTPCAVVENATTARQRTVVGDLASIAELVRDSGIQPPATLVVGETVMLRDAIEWFGVRPQGDSVTGIETTSWGEPSSGEPQ